MHDLPAQIQAHPAHHRSTVSGMTPAAVLWDMDGTLVDTEPYWIECEHELVEEFAGTWSSADAHSIVGFDLLDAAVILRDRGGVRLDPTSDRRTSPRRCDRASSP